MGDKSKIEWTEATWNPVTGCSKVSPGCAHCYAETLALNRLAGKPGYSGLPWTPENAAENVVLRPERLDQPLKWTRPRMIFVNSMSDLFHGQVPDGFIAWVFWTMSQCPQHTFQILTKRPERMRDFMLRWADSLDRDENGEPEHRMAIARGPQELRAKHNAGRALLMADMLEQWGEPPEGAAYPTYDWVEGPVTWPDVPPNVWLGVSIENRRYVHRADLLRETPAAVRFISAEPLLGPLVPKLPLKGGALRPVRRELEKHDWGALDLTYIDWLIVGGESGPGHRPMRVEWVRDLLLAAQTRCPLCLNGVALNADGWTHDCEPGYGTPGCERTAFFFKQWGGRTPKAGGRLLDGRTWDEMPVAPAVPA